VRTLDSRASERNVLDVGGRRAEPFFTTMSRAPQQSAQRLDPDSLSRRGENLPRLDTEPPTEADEVLRRGIRQWIFEEGTSAAEFFSGSAVDLVPPRVLWEILSNGIDEEGDCSYGLSLTATYEIAGVRARSLQVDKTITVPIDAPNLRIASSLELTGGPAVLLATEIPTRLGEGPTRLWIDGQEITAPTQERQQVSHVRIEAADGEF
jgi:hypothetical protein